MIFDMIREMDVGYYPTIFLDKHLLFFDKSV